MNSFMKKNIQLSALAAVATMVVGCLNDVGTIDRTQPNGIKKTQFSGLWYSKATIIASDPGADMAVDGYASGLEKIRWEITETHLIGYRSYEFVPYAEGKDYCDNSEECDEPVNEGRDFFGAPTMAYPIVSHFDVQRDYSRTTGVENNVIVENATDRPWFEREYIRVDWSTNVVGTPTPFWTGWSNFPEGYFSAYSLGKYFHQGHEETNPNRPTFTEDYMDITNRYHVEPDLYYCYLMLLYNGVPRCGAQNVDVRLSFRKVDPTDDFQSLRYPDNVELKDDQGNAIIVDNNGRRCDGVDGTGTRDPSDCRVVTFPYFEAFGNFRTQRVAFNKERFLTRTGRIYLAGRFDLWQDNYNDLSGAMIPYEEREVKPVVYYGNVDFPEEIIPSAQKMADQWNVPFTETVAYLQGYKTADGKADITAWQSANNGTKMFQFRQNSCNVEGIKAYIRAQGDNRAALEEVVDRVAGGMESIARGNIENVCAAIQFHQLNTLGYTLDPKARDEDGTPIPLAFQWEKEGDLRYHFQNYVDPDQAGPWGVAQFGTDPETGEYLSNAANYFGDAGDAITQREVDKLQWLNGELSTEDILRGDSVRNTVVSKRGEKNKSIRSAVRQALMESDRQIVEESGDSIFEDKAPGGEQERFRAMFEGTDIERELLVTDEILRAFAGPTLYQPADIVGRGGSVSDGAVSAFGAPAPGTVSAEALAAASPVNWGEGLQDNPYDRSVRELGERGMEMADFFEPTTAGLADFFKGKPREETYQWLRGEMYSAVQGHEVGHTVGLRHNFSASNDALNFRPEFWERYWNNEPTKENPNRGLEYKYASIMDYGFGVSLEGIHGIGPYDAAAVRFMYGELIDAWNPQKISIPDPRKYGSFARRCGHDSTWYGLPFLMRFLDYRNIPQILSVNAGETTYDDLFSELVVRIEANAAQRGDRSRCTLFISDLNWLMREVRNLEARPNNINDARMIVTAQELMNQEKASLLNPPEYDDPSTGINEAEDGNDDDGDGVVDDRGYNWNTYIHRVPYNFCTDNFAGFSPGCQRWDTGANFLEAVNHHIDAYDRDYLFSNFRRDRFSVSGWYNPAYYVYRLESRRLFHMTNVFRFYLYTRRTVFEADLFDNWAEASYRGLNFLERMIQTPEPGTYCLNTTNNMYEPKLSEDAPCNEEFDVGIGYGQGKFFTTSWTNEYHYMANRMGVFWDKMAAIRQITSSSGRFVRDFSDLFDASAFALGYLRTYEDPILRRWNGLVRGDHTGYQSAVVTDDDGNKSIRYMPFLDEEFEDGSSVRQELASAPKIAPSWSWTLQYYALAFGIANWSSIRDSSPEFYRFTKIAIEGTPEDVDYGSSVTMIEFTDPETRIKYRAPDIAARPRQVLNDTVPPYQRGNSWGIGAEILKDANTILTQEWQPAQVDCDNLTGSAKDEACLRFRRARQKLNEHVGFIDIIRRFNKRAELP